MKPRRIQRKRTKGWRIPKNTVYVGRPTKWGNPYSIGDHSVNADGGGYLGTRADVVRVYREIYERGLKANPSLLHELRGKNLACWCKLSEPCHGDVLLELANKKSRRIV